MFHGETNSMWRGMPRLYPILMRTVAFALIAVCGFGQTAPSPAPPQSKKHYDDVNRHGDMAMGFSHLKTTHHFRLLAGGGAIEVQADDPSDKQTLEHVRMHLQHTAQALPEAISAIPHSPTAARRPAFRPCAA